jgi:hypothetical protein
MIASSATSQIWEGKNKIKSEMSHKLHNSLMNLVHLVPCLFICWELATKRSIQSKDIFKTNNSNLRCDVHTLQKQINCEKFNF